MVASWARPCVQACGAPALPQKGSERQLRAFLFFDLRQARASTRIGRAANFTLGARAPVIPVEVGPRQTGGDNAVVLPFFEWLRRGLGLDAGDRRLLGTIIHRFDGGPVGIESLAASLAEDRDTLEYVYEPYLIQEGFLIRTPRGRQVTRQAYEHLKLPPPAKGSGGQGSLF
jgi:hypothetical protein